MNYVQGLRQKVGHAPLILTGAVVLIFKDGNQVLLQQRRNPYGMWGLPGGLMELEESTKETARREVYEETGLTLGRLHLLDVLSGKDYYI